MGERHFNNLDHAAAALPGRWYYDPAHYERELAAIWYRQWLFVCRSEAISGPLAFRVFNIGTQGVVLVRDDAGTLRAFFNTCRHRGSTLCTQAQGRLGVKLITCPYHNWSYALDGRLARTPNWTPGPDFDPSAHGLFPVAVREWRGFIFVNLHAGAPALEQALDPSPDDLKNWPLEALVTVHTRERKLHCNWKIFWENFLECYHCPNIHKELCELVPIYKRSLMDEHDAPDWQEHANEDDPAYRGGIRRDAQTWSGDGLVHGPRFEGLSEDELRRGHTFLNIWPTMFIVAHADYVRLVAILPDGPEHTLVRTQYLVQPSAAVQMQPHLDNIVSFVARVMDEDAAVCELNQQGLRALPFEQGVLVPQEYEVRRFHDWVGAQLDGPG